MASIMVGLLCWLAGGKARADEPFVLRAQLDGAPLGKHIDLLEDPSGALDIGQVSSPAYAGRFKRVTDDAPSLGFSTHAFWLRMTVRNPSAESLGWLLEIAYPHHDHVSLYIPHPDGEITARHTGDALPFESRDLRHTTFVFTLTEPPRSARTYYLRIQTGGSVNLPLKAWDAVSFSEHQARSLPAYWLFYGVMLVMAVYNGFVFLFVRQIEYLYYVLYNLSLLLFAFSLHGYTFFLILPDQMWLANHVIPFSVGLTFVWTTAFLRSYLSFKTTMPRADRLWRAAFWLCLAITLSTLLLPYAPSIRLVFAVGSVLTIIAPFFVITLIRRKVRAARIYLLAWSALIIGSALYLLKTVGVLSSNFFTEWGVQIGASLEVVILSLSLADRINTMRADMSALNTQLSRNVSDLKEALAEAHAATKAKSEFLATMSHELRTPLNAIINLPQGLLQDFRALETAVCGACDSLFELDQGDVVDASTPCPECAASALKRERILQYVGAPVDTARHLATIERAGKHLLDMVNGVLDFSKLEAGRIELNKADAQVAALLQDVIEPLEPLAKRAGVQLVAEPVDGDLWIRADALRIKQVLINLIGNAIKFSDGRGKVTVGAHRDRRGCVFFVRDQGIGIAPEHQERIFRSFEQVHRGDTRKYGGTGLGLSISTALIAKHDGHMWVESALGNGSTFFFSLPLTGAYASTRSFLAAAEAQLRPSARPPGVVLGEGSRS